MSKNLKKRINTSFLMLLGLYSMFMSQFLMGYFLIIIGILSILEFSNMLALIFKRKRSLFHLFNLSFNVYIFLFCISFFILSSFTNLKSLLLIIILTCAASDLGGYIFGKILKGPKLTKISPNKTISGAIGSAMLSILFLSVSTYFLTNIFSIYVVLIGFLISISSQLGDLFFSLIKRKSFKKDTGNFLPGHGGIIDRIDSMLLGIPTGLICIAILH